MNSRERYRIQKGFTYAGSLNVKLEDHKKYIRGTLKPVKVGEISFFEGNKKNEILF